MSSPERIDALLAAFGRVLDENAEMPALTRDEAASIADTLHADMDRGVEAREREAQALGHTVACAKGCSACCATIIITGEDEAATVARYLRRPEHAKKRERFRSRYKKWRAEHADVVDRAVDACARRDPSALGEAITEAERRRAMCPFNHQGGCEIHPVRPNVCRHAHALDTADECGHGGHATVLDFVPINDFLARIRPLQDLILAALPDAPPHRGPLADRVSALLR